MAVAELKPGTDRPQFLENGTEQLLGGGGGGVEHLHGHFFNPKHIPGKAGHFVGVKQQRIFLVAAVFGVELAGVEGWVEVARIGVGVAVHRSPGAVQGLLHIVNADQGIAALGILGGWAMQHPRRQGSTGRWMESARVGKHETALGRVGMRPETSRGFWALE